MEYDDLILKSVCEVFDFTFEQIKGKSKKRDLSDARAVLCELWYTAGNTSLSIGKRLNRNHTTILYYRKKHAELSQYDRAYAFKLKRVQVRLEQAAEQAITNLKMMNQ